LILLIPLIVASKSKPFVLSLLRSPLKSFFAFLSLALIILVEIGVPRLIIPNFPTVTLPLLAHILSFPLVLTCGSLVGPIGFTSSTLSLGLAAVVSINVIPIKFGLARIDDPKFISDAVGQLFRLQWFLTILVGSSLVFIVIQEEKAQAYLELEKANRQKSAFMAFLCHELRNPLHAILNVSSFLKENQQLNEEQVQLCDAICASSSYMSDLINDVLDTAKFEAGKVSLEVMPVRFRSLVDQIALPLKENLRTKSIVFKLELDQTMPDYLEIDPTRVKQILSNLLSNAVKFTPKGEGRQYCQLQSQSRQTPEFFPN
ncbi:hypothetical protein HDV05_000481, partial [Chytridiales sp. JEL 0842]